MYRFSFAFKNYPKIKIKLPNWPLVLFTYGKINEAIEEWKNGTSNKNQILMLDEDGSSAHTLMVRNPELSHIDRSMLVQINENMFIPKVLCKKSTIQRKKKND